jgi:nucleoid-associated protein YgaU
MATRRTTKKSVRPTKVGIKTASSRTSIKEDASDDIFKKVSGDLQQNNTVLNLILGALVVIVAGALIFNYFKSSSTSQTDISSDSTQQTQQEQSADVSKDQLPGQYVVKDGDTLFTIAQSYYNDGFKYPELVKANSMADENQIAVGQKINIPKLDQAATSPQNTPEASVEQTLNAQTSPTPADSPSITAINPQSSSGADNSELGTGGAVNQTIWGEKIASDTYTVQQGDWLSTIAGRSYGDAMMFSKIAQANNIQNPDVIEPGTILKIPR